MISLRELTASVSADRGSTSADLAKRLEQAREAMQLTAASRVLIDEQVGMVVDAWATAFGAHTTEKDGASFWEFKEGGGEVWPKPATVRRFLGDLPLDDVLRAVDIAAARFEGQPGSPATRYFYGICYRALRTGSRISADRTRQTYSLDSPEVMSLEREAFDEGEDFGRSQEHSRLREFLLHHQDNGYPTVGDAVLALWPDEE
jgi:hypothetical protein